MQERNELLAEARVLVKGAFRSRQEMIDQLCEFIRPSEIEHSKIAEIIDLLVFELNQDRMQWPGVTDCDRLDVAFARMFARGIIALQNAAFFNDECHDEVMNVARNFESPDELAGFCFYSEQDLGHAINGRGLSLRFGSLDPSDSDEKFVQVGKAVVEELTRAGLGVSWNESADERIEIPKLVWQRR